MMSPQATVLGLVALLTTGVAHTQDSSQPPEPGTVLQTACFVDDRLSVWLSLEAADRMVAALETERRELIEQQTTISATLKLMDEGRIAGQGLTLTQIGVLMSSQAGSRELLVATRDEIETRLDEVGKTLKRRRLQRAKLEEWLNLYLGTGAADGS